MTTAQDAAQEQYLTWVRAIFAERPYGEGDRIGSLNLIDDNARTRGRAAVRSGRSVSLSRPVRADSKGGPAFSMQIYRKELGPTTVMAGDHVELECHGFDHTHIDALNHMAYDRRWYGGGSVDEADYVPSASVIDLADVGIFTRAIYVDVPGIRGVRWVTPDEPVTSDDIERSIAAAGLTFEAGDALLLDCGRDQYEAQHGSIAASTQRGGSGASAAEWLVDSRPSLLCWDMLDVANDTDPRSAIHLLHWASGLVLVDNCDFSAARLAMSESARNEGGLVVAPLRIAGATGCNVNPQLLL